MLKLLRKNLSKQLLVVVESAAISALSTLNYSTSLVRPTVYKDERREFLSVAPDLVRNLTEYASKYDSKDASKIYEKALQYNITGTRQQQGIVTVLAYKGLADKIHLNSENLKLAQYLGWCVELMTNTINIADDIMDRSITREGQPCWYLLDEVGLRAINDSLMILNGTYHILKENFEQKDYYVKLLELFHEVIFISTIGQSIDAEVSKGGVTCFTMDRYKSLCTNKTAYLAVYLPVASAMHLCGFTDPDIYRQAKATLIEIGQQAQVLNDYYDCFGDPGESGKIGTDIQESKCTWLAVVCMEIASEAQKKIMRECYGKSDPAKVAQVKHLYEELGLPNLFTAYKEEAFNKIITNSQQNSGAFSLRLYKILAPLISDKIRTDLTGSSNF